MVRAEIQTRPLVPVRSSNQESYKRLIEAQKSKRWLPPKLWCSCPEGTHVWDRNRGHWIPDRDPVCVDCGLGAARRLAKEKSRQEEASRLAKERTPTAPTWAAAMASQPRPVIQHPFGTPLDLERAAVCQPSPLKSLCHHIFPTLPYGVSLKKRGNRVRREKCRKNIRRTVRHRLQRELPDQTPPGNSDSATGIDSEDMLGWE
jgi:hypothetical protein